MMKYLRRIGYWFFFFFYIFISNKALTYLIFTHVTLSESPCNVGVKNKNNNYFFRYVTKQINLTRTEQPRNNVFYDSRRTV